MIFPGSSLRGVNRCGQNKRQVATQIEATSVAGAQYMLRNFVPGDGHGAWQRLAVHAHVAVHRTIIVCADCVAPTRSNSKEAHLTCSKLIQF